MKPMSLPQLLSLTALVTLLALPALVGCSKTAEAPAATAAAPMAAPATAKAGAYSCPMHPEVVSDAPGKCPKCGMALVSTAPQAAIEVAITTTPPKPKAGEKTSLSFEMKSAGARLADFDVVHEKKLHLLMVTPDLAWFSHEHPEPRADGTFGLDFTFPAGGTYRLFSDFKAAGRAGAVIPTDIVVDGPPAAKVALSPSDLTQARDVNGIKVRFTSAPPSAGASRSLSFLITKDDKPVEALEPYLGAMGHLVIIGEDGTTFLHAHPDDHAPAGHAHDSPDAGVHGHGPAGVVTFATKFPHAGVYKAWVQVQFAGTVHTADFVFNVAPGAPLAPGAAAAGDGHGHAH